MDNGIVPFPCFSPGQRNLILKGCSDLLQSQLIRLRQEDPLNRPRKDVTSNKDKVELPSNLVEGDTGSVAQLYGGDGLGEHGKTVATSPQVKREDFCHQDLVDSLEDVGVEERVKEDECDPGAGPGRVVRIRVEFAQGGQNAQRHG